MKRPWLWLIVVTNLAALIGLAFVYPRAMTSPGPLVPAHAALADRCLSCHAPFRGVAADRCITCHVVADIGVRTTRGAPVEHPSKRPIRPSFHQELAEQSCGSCHSDHGRLVERRFSHALLDPAARGACATCHAPPTNDIHRDLRVSCVQCHTTEHWAPATFDHAALPGATLARCESCHAAPTDGFHRQATAPCAGCHTPAHWKPSTFDHGRFFVLDRHHDAACTTCHASNDFKRYTCFGCHKHTPAKIRAKHDKKGIQNIDDCVSCHRSAAGEHDGGSKRRKDRKDKEH